MGRGGPVERGCGWPSALPHKHIHVSDPCPVPLQLFLIFGPSMPPAMRPQMRCLSLPPAPAPSSYRTMPGGFPRFQPGEWGAGGWGKGGILGWRRASGILGAKIGATKPLVVKEGPLRLALISSLPPAVPRCVRRSSATLHTTVWPSTPT